MDSTTVDAKKSDPKKLTTDSRKEKAQKEYVSEDPESDPNFQTHHRANLIFPMTENIKSIGAIRRKSTGSTRNRTCQNHRQRTLISLKEVIIKTKDAIKRRTTRKRNRTLSDYA